MVSTEISSLTHRMNILSIFVGMVRLWVLLQKRIFTLVLFRASVHEDKYTSVGRLWSVWDSRNVLEDTGFPSQDFQQHGVY